MESQSLVERSKNLTGLSLESFISDTTSSNENHCFFELLSHPNVGLYLMQIGTVKPRSIQIIKLFSSGSYNDYKELKVKLGGLNEKQESALKRLTILSEFRMKNTTFVSSLCRQTDSSEEHVLQMLLKMSIDGAISVKIDQQKGVITTLHSELRKTPMESQDTVCIHRKISSILQKNRLLETQLKQISGEGQRSKKKSILGGFFRDSDK